MVKCRCCSKEIDLSKHFDRHIPGGYRWVKYEPGSFKVHACSESATHKKRRLIREADAHARRYCDT